MTKEEIQTIIEKYIQLHQQGLEIENPKVDLKRSWYKLDKVDDTSEFLKDVSAIGNTVGLDGYLVIGYDTKTKKFHPAKTSDSTKNDLQINQILSSGIEGELFVNIHDIEIDNNSLSVIHIPPQFNKPFAVRNYKKNNSDNLHRVFVRKSSANSIANKYDLDFIYYDKKNLIPEYGFDVTCQNVSFNFQSQEFFVALIIENFGLKPIAIVGINITALVDNKTFHRQITLNRSERDNTGIRTNPLVIKHNEIGRFPYLVGYINEDKKYIEEISNKFPKVERFVLHFFLSNDKVFAKTIFQKRG